MKHLRFTSLILFGIIYNLPLFGRDDIKRPYGTFNYLSKEEKTVEFAWYNKNQDTTFFLLPDTIIEEGISYRVANIGVRAFYGADKLIEIILSDNLDSIKLCAFYNCRDLSKINIPQNIRHIGHEAFDGCTKIEKVCNFSSFDLSKEDISFKAGRIFNDCQQEDGIVYIVQDGNKYICDYTGDKKYLAIPKEYRLTDRSFCYCQNIDTIAFEYEDKDMLEIPSRAFYHSSLSHIVLDNDHTDIKDYAFYGCSNLKNINFTEMANIEDYAFAFSGLEAIDLSETFLLSFGERAFENCTELKKVKLSEEVDYIPKYCFSNCYRLEEIDLSGIYRIRDGAFANCIYLPIELPESLAYIDAYAFYGCDNDYKPIYIPKNVTHIGEQAFTGYNDFSVDPENPVYYSAGGCLVEKASHTLIMGFTADIPEGIKGIATGAMYQKLIYSQYLRLPVSLEWIGEDALGFYINLKNIYVKWDVPIEIPLNLLGKCFDDYDKITLHVPVGTKSKYEQAQEWGRFKNIVEDESVGIEEIHTPGVNQGSLYTLDGRRVSAPHHNVPYIKQGKKTVILTR